MMKIYLDDVRNAPDGWTVVRTAEMAIQLLKQGGVSNISLDHDLGENKKTGYDVLKWIEKQVATKGFIPPDMRIHTQNPVGRETMNLAIESIKRLQEN